MVVSGTWTGWSRSPGDSGFTISGTINGRAFLLVVDYGSNTTAVTERALDSLRLPRPYANATRVRAIPLRPGVAPALDSTANATVQVADTIKQYWGDFEPTLLDSLRIGTSLQRHVYLPGAMASSIYSFDALIGRDMLSQFDVEFDGPGRAVRLYERSAPDSSARAPRWLPPGVTTGDCIRAALVRPQSVPSPSPSDTAGMSEAEKREELDGMIAARRLLEQIELRFPVVADGHPIDATFDSGTSEAIINWAEARVLGLTPASPRVRPDSADPAWVSVVNDVVLRVGSQTLPSPRVWIVDLKFSGAADYRTKPMMLLGVSQFRDRVLFMSHSTGTVCISQPARARAGAVG